MNIKVLNCQKVNTSLLYVQKRQKKWTSNAKTCDK